MSEILERREAALIGLGECKPNIAVSLDEVRQIDEALKSRWKIDFTETKSTLLEALEELTEGDVRSRVLAAYKADQASVRRGADAVCMYEAMTDAQICGLVTSCRRHYLLDSIAMACSLYRLLQLSGPILDIGCHVGVAPDVLARQLGISVVGLEPVGSAVQAGAVRLGSTSGVTIVHGAIPWQTEQRFQLVTAIDCLPGNAGDRAVFLNGLSQLLDDGGIAMVVSATWVDANVPILRRQLDAAGLGFGFADVVGGYGGMPTSYLVEGCVCLIKNGKRSFPRMVSSAMQSEWSLFQSYANAPTTPIREKTQAFMRAGYRGHSTPYPQIHSSRNAR
jgi:hypothetical protein